MTKVYYCKFNIDTGCVELICADGRMISIGCTSIEDEIANNRYERAELDYLIYNHPIEYANLVFSGEICKYINGSTNN